MKDCFLAVLSSHGEEGCVFGADGIPVQLSRIFTCFKNPTMDRKAKLFLIQVSSRRGGTCRGVEGGVLTARSACRPVEEAIWTTAWRWTRLETRRTAASRSTCPSL